MNLKHILAAVAVPLLSACPQQAKPLPTPLPVSIARFDVSAASVAPGTTVTLTWETQNATSVALSQVGVGPIAIDAASPSGQVEVTVSADATFLLTAKGDGGSDTGAVMVQATVGETRVMFAAVPAEILAGQSTTLVFSAPGSKNTSVTPAGGAALDLGGKTESGSVSVSPSRTTRYDLVADGRTASATVEVTPAIISFSASPSAQPGQPVTLSWRTTGGSRVTLSRDGAGTIYFVGDEAKVVAGSFDDQVPATLPQNGLLSYRLRVDEGTLSSSQDLTVYVGVDPRITKLTVPSTIRAGSQFQVAWSTENADRVQLVQGGQVLCQALTQAETVSGSCTLAAPSATVTLELRATNARGGLATLQRTVEPVGAPTFVSLTADKQPGIAVGGEAVTLSWDVTFARHVTIATQKQGILKDLKGVLDTGTAVLYPNEDTVYTLTADNGAGQSIAPQSVTVTVGAPAKFTFSTSAVPLGSTSSITGHSVPGGGAVLGLPVVEKNASGDAFVDISATGTDINYAGPDTTAKLVTLPEVFSTVLYGGRVSGQTLSISINGWFAIQDTTFGGPDGPGTSPLPSTGLVPLAIAPYWADLYDIAASEIYTQLDTVGGEQRLIVQWNEVEYDLVAGSRATFQAQLFSGGKVVFAYSKLQGVSGAGPSIGIVNFDESAALLPPGVPAEGDTYRFFGSATLPFPMTTAAAPYLARVLIGTDGFIEMDANPPLLPPGTFAISELNPWPAAAVTSGEWIKISNYTADAVDLNGWTLDFGGGNTHTISTPLTLPANGRLLLAQSATAGDGLTADYVYPSTLVMADTAGTLKLMLGSGTHSAVTWSATSATAAGVSVRADPPGREWRFATGKGPQLDCSSAGGASYGSNGQLGTPAAASPRCLPYQLSSLATGAFESIAATGTAIVLGSAGRTATDDVYFTVALPTPVKVNGNTVSTLYVCTNGFLSATPLTTTASGGKTAPSTTAPVGVIAPYWDDLEGNAGATSGVFWQQLDPDSTPASGDEYTVISWEDWKHYDYTASMNIQVKLRANGDIEFHYGSMTAATQTYAQGVSATTWIDEPTGRAALVANLNSATPGIAPNSAYRFTYSP